MLTENSAMKKWCPFTGAERIIPAYGNEGEPPYRGRCIGFLCMAWRWEDRLHERGYCGMAGKPVVP
jgi:hypothetical protein